MVFALPLSSMDEQKRTMIENAEKQFEKIHPCGSNTSFSDCFTTVGDVIVFWFNTDDRSTHVITSTTR
jgi:hypothetical protein